MEKADQRVEGLAKERVLPADARQHGGKLGEHERAAQGNDAAGEDANIYRAQRSATSQPFGMPIALTQVNTMANEFDPSLSSDALTLFFGSDRVSGEGRHLYVSTRTSRQVHDQLAGHVASDQRLGQCPQLEHRSVKLGELRGDAGDLIGTSAGPERGPPRSSSKNGVNSRRGSYQTTTPRRVSLSASCLAK